MVRQLLPSERPMTADWPAVAGIDASVYVIPTDAPEADGTLAWNETTMVLVTAQAGGQEGIGWSYAAAAAASVVNDVLADVVDRPQRAATWPAPPRPWRAPCATSAGAGSRPRPSPRSISRCGTSRPGCSASRCRPARRARQDVPIYGSGGFTSYDEHQTRQQLPRLGRAGPHPAGEDQDRRGLGRQRAP